MGEFHGLLERAAQRVALPPDTFERIVRRRRRRQRNRRVLAGSLAMAMAVSGLTGVYLAFRPGDGMEPGLGGASSPACFSENEPGLITCEHALLRAGEEEGQADASGVDARLEWYTPRQGEDRIRVWIVTYRDVPMLPSGPAGTVPECSLRDWDVVIDATTGGFLVAGNSGDGARPCPSTPAGSTPPLPTSLEWRLHGLDWDNPLFRSIEVGSTEEAAANVAFEPREPMGLGVPLRIVTTDPAIVPESAEAIVWIYQHPVHGRFFVEEGAPTMTQEELESAVVCGDGEAGCSTEGWSLLTARGGITTLLIDGPPDRGFATSITWLEDGLQFRVMGPRESFTSESALAIANGM